MSNTLGVEAQGSALGGRAGARLAAVLGLAGAPSEILSILSTIHVAADEGDEGRGARVSGTALLLIASTYCGI